MKKQNVLAVTGAILIIAATSAVSVQASGNRGGGPQGGPPPEAIEACEGMEQGDSVSFKGRRGESLQATCELVEDQLVAVPEGHERPGGSHQ